MRHGGSGHDRLRDFAKRVRQGAPVGHRQRRDRGDQPLLNGAGSAPENFTACSRQGQTLTTPIGAGAGLGHETLPDQALNDDGDGALMGERQRREFVDGCAGVLADLPEREQLRTRERSPVISCIRAERLHDAPERVERQPDLRRPGRSGA